MPATQHGRKKKRSEKMPEIYIKEIIVKVRPRYINMKMLSHLSPPPNFASEGIKAGCLLSACYFSGKVLDFPSPPPPHPSGLQSARLSAS